MITTASGGDALNNSVTQIFVVERRVVGVVVGDEQVDVEAEIINLTDPESLPSKPVSVQQLVRVAIEGELVESAVTDLDFGKYSRARPDNTVVKILTVRQLWCQQVLDGQIVRGLPDLLEKHDVVVLLRQIPANVLHPLVSVFGYPEAEAPAVEGDDADLSLHTTLL